MSCIVVNIAGCLYFVGIQISYHMYEQHSKDTCTIVLSGGASTVSYIRYANIPRHYVRFFVCCPALKKPSYLPLGRSQHHKCSVQIIFVTSQCGCRNAFSSIIEHCLLHRGSANISVIFTPLSPCLFFLIPRRMGNENIQLGLTTLPQSINNTSVLCMCTD